MSRRILVTGGNAGIGLALCKQLVIEHNAHVYMGVRSLERGEAALRSLSVLPEGCNGLLELVQLDTADDASVRAAAATVRKKIGRERLYAVVNNAGVGLGHGVDPGDVLNTNLYGPKRVADAFLPILSPSGRIINVGSGGGPGFVRRAEATPIVQKQLCSSVAMAWEEIEEIALSQLGSDADTNGGYGLSKACLAAWTKLLAKQNPSLKVACCTPGFIDTAMTKGFGATKAPEEGTVSIRHCLFSELGGSGWYYGSDGVRSPYHFMRNPGEPEYDGVSPFD